MRFIDLFCGIGGFRQALEDCGSTCVFSSDWDKDAQFTYLQNYDEGPSGDLTEVKATEVPDHEVLCGGFPCQPFSISGNQGGFEDTRGTLLHEILSEWPGIIAPPFYFWKTSRITLGMTTDALCQ